MNTSRSETKAEMAEEIAMLRKRVQKLEKAKSKPRQTETKLGNNLSLLNSIIAETTDVIFVKDLKGRHLLVNSACAQIIGKSAKQIIGKNNEQLFPPEVARHLTEIDETDRSFRSTTDSGRSCAARWLRFSANLSHHQNTSARRQ